MDKAQIAAILASMTPEERAATLKAAGVSTGMSQEAKDKLAKSMREHYAKTGGMSQEAKDKLANSMREHYAGKGMDEATKDKIRQSMLAREAKAKRDAAEVEQLRQQLAELTAMAQRGDTLRDPSWTDLLDKEDQDTLPTSGTLNSFKDEDTGAPRHRK